MTNINNNKPISETFISILYLIGFDQQIIEKQYKISINSSTFNKPNTKAFEIVVHHLLTQLDNEQSNRVFRDCWPALLKEQQKEFRDNVYSWLIDISSKFKTVKFPSITKSLLLTPSGTKLYELLFSLSQCVLISKINQLNDTYKLNIYIFPKLYLNSQQQLSQLLQQQQTIDKAKLLSNKKHYLYYLFVSNTYKTKLNNELKYIEKLLLKLVKLKSKHCEFVDDKVKQIRNELNYKNELNCKDIKFYELIKQRLDANIKSESNDNIEKIINDNINNFIAYCYHLNNKLNNYDNNYKVQLNSINKNKLANAKLDLLNYSFRIPQFIIVDCNIAIKSNKIGDIYTKGEIDLMNLAKLNYLTILIQTEPLFKVDKKMFNDLVNSIDHCIKINDGNNSINHKKKKIKNEISFLIPQLSKEIIELKSKLVSLNNIINNNQSIVNQQQINTTSINTPYHTIENYFKEYKTPKLQLTPINKNKNKLFLNSLNNTHEILQSNIVKSINNYDDNKENSIEMLSYLLSNNSKTEKTTDDYIRLDKCELFEREKGTNIENYYLNQNSIISNESSLQLIDLLGDETDLI